MSTDIFDYLKWRGDLSFADVRLCEVDCLAFSMMSYLDYTVLCPGEMTLLSEAAAGYCPDDRYDSVNLGLIMPSKQINRMFCEAADTRRFGNVRISDFQARTNEEEAYQFGAVTFHLPGRRMLITYRGTDDSIAGWREDCCLSFLDEVPAQGMAVDYLEAMAAKYPEERIYLCGHSKGGNLSLYAAASCSEAVQSRILRAYSLDGPGLSRRMIASEGFRRVQRKMTVLLPQSSYIGIMFEKGEKYTVIKSNGRGLFQHDPYTWELDGPALVRLPGLSYWGKRNEEQFRVGMQNMTPEEKKEFVDTMFDMVESTGAKTLTDFTDGGVGKLMTFVKSYTGLDKKKRDMMVSILLKLLDLKKAER